MPYLEAEEGPERPVLVHVLLADVRGVEQVAEHLLLQQVRPPVGHPGLDQLLAVPLQELDELQLGKRDLFRCSITPLNGNPIKMCSFLVSYRLRQLWCRWKALDLNFSTILKLSKTMRY